MDSFNSTPGHVHGVYCSNNNSDMHVLMEYLATTTHLEPHHSIEYMIKFYKNSMEYEINMTFMAG